MYNDFSTQTFTGTEEECKAEFKPIVQLEEVEVKSGEEEETALFDS